MHRKFESAFLIILSLQISYIRTKKTTHAHYSVLIQCLDIMSKSARKRLATVSVSDVDEGHSLYVEGKIVHLSPMKKSRSTDGQYFEGKISDKKKSLRFVGFDCRKRELIEDYYENKKTVIVANCTARPSKLNNQLQVLINDITDFEDSDTTFTDVIDDTILLEQLPTLYRFQKVKFTATVTCVKDVMSVGKAKVQTQEVYIGDATYNCKLQLWDTQINALEEGKTYSFQNCSVSEFNGKKYLTTTNDSSFEETTSIGEVVNSNTTQNAYSESCEIIAVQAFKRNRVCLSCKYRVTESKPGIAKCGKCDTLQKLIACPTTLTAKLLLKSDDFGTKTFTFYGSHIASLIDTEQSQEDITEEDLLLANKFAFTYNGDSVVSIEKDAH